MGERGARLASSSSPSPLRIAIPVFDGLTALVADEWTARAIALGMEYDPEPPFAGGSVATTSPELVEFVRARRSSLA